MSESPQESNDRLLARARILDGQHRELRQRFVLAETPRRELRIDADLQAVQVRDEPCGCTQLGPGRVALIVLGGIAARGDEVRASETVSASEHLGSHFRIRRPDRLAPTRHVCRPEAVGGLTLAWQHTRSHACR